MKGNYKIPFTKTTLGEEEKRAVADVIDSGWVVMGAKTREFEEKFAEYVGSKYAVFVDSGTSALFLALQYLKKEKKFSSENVLEVPSLTFTATAEAAIHAGFTIEFGDVDKSTLCLEVPHLDSIPVHLVGNKAREGAIVYDSAHRIEQDDMLGTELGEIWCYSLYATKNMTSVQGGMIAVNTIKAAEWLRLARDHGLSKDTEARYKDGKWQYSVDFVGWREKSDDIHAAIGLEQLKKLPAITEARNQIVQWYNDYLGLKRKGNHLYYIFVENRDMFINYMEERGIQCSVHFLPLHKMPAYKDCKRGNLKNTEWIGDHIVSIPLYPQMTIGNVEEIAGHIKLSNQMIYE